MKPSVTKFHFVLRAALQNVKISKKKIIKDQISQRAHFGLANQVRIQLCLAALDRRRF